MKKMKKITLGCLAAIMLVSIVACHDSETYADQKKKERTAIRAFIEEQGINVISEKEFVLFENTGVYMQIVRRGCGEKIKQGETTNVLCRFNEYNLLTDSLFLTNNLLEYSSYPDKMAVTNTLGTFTATFVSGTMMMAYQTTSVPAGWLIPLSYINVGRMLEENDELAKVKLIVPHSQGTSYALSNVQPCYYELTYQRGL